MAAPNKPWENPGGTSLNSSQPVSSLQGAAPIQGVPARARGPPPLPPRARRSQPIPSMMPYASYGAGAYSGMYSNYSNPYSGFGYGYGGMPMGGMYNYDSRLMQLLEESTQPAFSSIESFVRMFSSMTMMLESSFQALHMSFRAVVSMAENMSQMRTLLVGILSNLTIVRLAYRFFRRLLYLLGLVRSNPLTEDAWTAAATSPDGSAPSQSAASWPVLAFVGFIIGAPYLVLRLMPTPSSMLRVKARALYDFSSPARGELGFLSGDTLYLRPDFRKQMNSGWVLASNGKSSGYVPISYLQLPSEAQESAPDSGIIHGQ